MIEIQRLDDEEWIPHKTIIGNDFDTWNKAVKEVYELNSTNTIKYRALYENGFLTHIYCSSFYTVPTIRFW